MAVIQGKRALPLSRVHGLLEPGPVVLLITAHGGRQNVMALSWHATMEFEPPPVSVGGCVVSANDFSFVALNATCQCAIRIPSAALAAKVVACGNTSGRDLDKFAAFGLTPLPASVVAVPLVGECFASLECRVADCADGRRMFAAERYGAATVPTLQGAALRITGPARPSNWRSPWPTRPSPPTPTPLAEPPWRPVQTPHPLPPAEPLEVLGRHKNPGQNGRKGAR